MCLRRKTFLEAKDRFSQDEALSSAFPLFIVSRSSPGKEERRGLGALDHFPNATPSPFQAPPWRIRCVWVSGLMVVEETLPLRSL